ncbi:MAG: preprotein translocase subunit SecE [Eubacteriales bacterium]|nr:preprotein translocase subunit SecE [Eubacteriales bacterium]
MARKDKGQRSRVEKPGFFKRIRNFFKNIFQELKRVSWPDWPTLRQNTTTVLVIILVAAVSIWLFDMAIQGVLNATGFYSGH